MKAEQIMTSDVLDILFENRNKEYGAYNLRKNYNKRLMRALYLMLVVVGAFAVISFIPKKQKSKPDNPVYETTTYQLAKPEPKKKEVEKPKVEQKTASTTKTPEAPKPVIVDDRLVKSQIKNTNDSIDVVVTPPNITTGGGPVIGDPGPGSVAPVSDPVIPAKPEVDKVTPRLSADVMPEYPGGIEALRKFLERNLQNPEEMAEGSLVSVKIQFVVGYDGKLKGFKTVQDGGTAFNNEVIRVLKKMPDWIPGKANGENVSVYYVVPVRFVPAD